MPRKLSHYDRTGKARMVDVSDKSVTRREAEASAFVALKPKVLKALPKNPKGDPLEVARLAGIMAAKQTSNLIPMCHPLMLTLIDVDCVPDERLPGIRIEARVRCDGKTGAEMEALTAVAVAALTVVDMAKSVDRWMTIEGVELVEKRGGKSGELRRPANGRS